MLVASHLILVNGNKQGLKPAVQLLVVLTHTHVNVVGLLLKEAPPHPLSVGDRGQGAFLG